MFRRFWSIGIVTCAVFLCSATLASAEAFLSLSPVITDPGDLVVRADRGALLPAIPGSPSSTSEPGDDDAPNRDGNWRGGTPVLDDSKDNGVIQFWSFRYLGTNIRLQLLKYLSVLR
jgi:hypothetical protein